MQIYLDSAEHREIEKWMREGIVDGVTTNPSILFKDGVFAFFVLPFLFESPWTDCLQPTRSRKNYFKN